MAFQPGRQKTGGRHPGVPNRLTTNVKTAIEEAFNEVGGTRYLVQVARDEPAIFLRAAGQAPAFAGRD